MARTKHIGDAYYVAHSWGNLHRRGTESPSWAASDRSRENGHRILSYNEDGTLFSYRTVMAQMLPPSTPGGEIGIAMFRKHVRDCSVTTGRHYDDAVAASRHNCIQFFVEHTATTREEVDHETNLQGYEADMRRLYEEATGPRQAKHLRAERLRTLASLAMEAERYIEVFSEYTRPITYPGNFADSPAILEEAEECRRVYGGRRTRSPQNLEKQIEKFRKHKISKVNSSFQYLRLSKTSYTVETSQGVTFPVSHARRAISFLRKLREQGGIMWRRGDTTTDDTKVGAFRLDVVDFHSRYVQAGCHRVAFDEIDLLEASIKQFYPDTAPVG